jgi:hypothetical protein
VSSRRQHPRTARLPAPDHAGTPDPVALLLATGVRLAGRPDLPAAALDPVTTELADRDPLLATAYVPTLARRGLRDHYELGWQPADLVHVAKRRVNQRAARLAAAVVTEEAAVSRALHRAPAAWVAQLTALDGAPADVPGWWRQDVTDPATGWRDVLRLLATWTALPRVEALLPPPSAWPGEQRSTRPPTAPAAGPSGGQSPDKVLARIRALLAKAESTDFSDEADALTAKAQQLMSRYEIDAAVLAAAGPAGQADGVLARRLHLSNPYAEPKAHLLQAIAAANGARVVLFADLGIATVIGLPVDLDLVELLFTSLLLQVNRALAGTVATAGASTRSAAYRRGFLYSYATRIGERLAEARTEAAAEATREYGTSLVPVLARKAEAVDSTVAELFPRLTTRRGPVVDAAGWRAGKLAAENADLGDRRSAVTGGRP